MRNRILFLASLVLLVSVNTLNAQTVDEVLNKYFKASGTEKWADVKTVVMKASIEQMGMELPMVMKMKRPNKFRMEMEMQGQQMVQAFDGEKGWMIAPWMSADVQDLTGDQLKQAMDQADTEGELYNYAKKGNQVELTGKETIDGKEYFVLKVTSKNGQVKTYFIDAATYVLAKVKAKVSAMGQEMEIEQIMVEYMDVNGIKMPKKIESKTPMGSGFINFNEVVFDTPLDDAIFTRPAK